VDFLRVPLIAIVGWRLYAEALDPMIFLGAACLVVGIVWNLLAASRVARVT
jgi:drug/metabolite transporter (DMT)-like permease